MGLNGSAKLLETLRKFSKKAFFEVMPAKDEAEFVRKKKAAAKDYNIVRNLPRDVQFEACALDLSSLLIPLVHKTAVGSEIRERLRKIIYNLVEERGATRIAICVDNSDHVPPVKVIEHARRASSGHKTAYPDDAVSLSGTDLTVPVDDYEFADDVPVPDDAMRIKKTRKLMRRLIQYLAQIATEDLVVPHPVTIVFCGARFEIDGKWTARTLIRTYTGKTCSKPKIINQPAVRIGEGEGKCVYWMLRWFREIPTLASFAMMCNDTDAFTALLLNVPRILSLPELQPHSPAPHLPQTTVHRRKTREIWLDWTSPSTHKRFANITDVWRGIHSWTNQHVPAPMHQHFPAAALLFATILGGCDYLQPISRTRAAPYVNEYIAKPKTLASNKAEDNSAIMFSSKDPFAKEAFVVEGKMYDLVYRGLLGTPGVKRILARIGAEKCSGRKLNAKQAAEEGDKYLKTINFKDRFNKLSVESRRENDRLEKEHKRIDEENQALPRGAKKKSKPTKAPEIPTFDGLAALVRRALWSLIYFRNIGIQDEPLSYIDPLASLGGRSVYGYSLDENGRIQEAHHILSADAIDQPFVHIVRGELRSDAKRRRELLSSSASIGKPKRPLSAPSVEHGIVPPPKRARMEGPVSAPGRARRRTVDETTERIEFLFNKNFDVLRTREEVDLMQRAVAEPHGTFFDSPDFSSFLNTQLKAKS